MTFTFGLTLGAAMLAVWLDGRLGDRRPHTHTQRLVHALLSVVALFASVGLLYLVRGVPQGPFMGAVLVAFLPALVYALLAGLWMLRTLADIGRLVGR